MFRAAVFSALLLIGAIAAQPAAAQSAGLDFNFIELDYQVVDLDKDETLSLNGGILSAETDDDAGWRAAFGWEFLGHFHLFGEYSTAENDVELAFFAGNVVDVASGDVDVVRASGGIGYGWPLSEQWTMYSRISWDYIELDDLEIGGVSVGDLDDDGLGFEAGLRWLALPRLELQAYGRYSDVGELDLDDDEFDDDLLGGVAARWWVHPSLALQVGGEFGDIVTFGGGMRFSF